VPIWGLTRLTASFGLGFVGFERGDRLSLRDYSTLMGPTSAFPERRCKSQFRRRGMPNQQPRPRSSPSLFGPSIFPTAELGSYASLRRSTFPTCLPESSSTKDVAECVSFFETSMATPAFQRSHYVANVTLDLRVSDHVSLRSRRSISCRCPGFKAPTSRHEMAIFVPMGDQFSCSLRSSGAESR